MMPIQCASCKHYRGDLKCDAYPKRIPVPLLTGEADHTKPYKNDQGIRWEKLKKK